MAQQPMYPAKVNSPITELAADIDAAVTTITVVNGDALPAAPNLAVIGTGEDAETILYTGKTGNDLTGVTRGFQSVAKSWQAGAKVARYFTAYDHDAFRGNIADHETRLTGAESTLSAATNAATPNTVVKRDANGRIKAAAPSATDDVARKAETDAALSLAQAALPKNGSQAMTGTLKTDRGSAAGGQLHHELRGQDGKTRIAIGLDSLEGSGIEGSEYAVWAYDNAGAWLRTLLRIRRDGTAFINEHIAWHNGNNSASLVSAGYQRLASGLIIQWGTTPGINPGTTGEALFPIVFPNACLSVVATVESWPEVAAVVVNAVSTNVFGVNHNAPSARSIRFIAVGY